MGERNIAIANGERGKTYLMVHGMGGTSQRGGRTYGNTERRVSMAEVKRDHVNIKASS